MNALELTQRQRELLGNIVKAAQQYQQAIADASARLTHELEQIEQSRDKERQRIEEERKEKAKTKIDSALGGIKESYREETKQGWQQEIAARRSTITLATGITTIEALRREINRPSSAGIDLGTVSKIAIILIFGGLASSFVAGWVGMSSSVAKGGFVAFIFGLFLLAAGLLADAQNSLVNKIALLHRLYDRWLELVDEQAGAQRAEAQRRYEQAVAQAKGQMLAAAEQSRPAIAEFGALTEPVSPPWGSEAWRQWEPGRLGPGAVRLGVFTRLEV